MATATQQTVGLSNAGTTSLQINITSTLAGSVISVGSQCGFASGVVTINAPTDSASQTYASAATQTNVGGAPGVGQRIDHVLNSGSGVTWVKINTASSTEVTGTVAELTGTANAVRGTVPAQTTAASAVTSLATGSITASAGDILAGFITDNGGSNTQYGVSASYTADAGAVPNGANERGGGSHADNVSGGALACTFTFPSTNQIVAGQVCYQVGAGGPTAALVDMIGHGSIPVARL